MANAETMSLEDCCRLCLKTLTNEGDNNFSLTNHPGLQLIILECFQIQVSDGEIVSKACTQCMDEIRLVNRIRKRIRKADFEIKQYYASLAFEEEAGSEMGPDEFLENEEMEYDDELVVKSDVTIDEEDNSADNENFTEKYDYIEVEPLIEYDGDIAEDIANHDHENKCTSRMTRMKRKKSSPSDTNARKTVDYKCYICATECYTSEQLDAHLPIHAGTGPQVCNFCDSPLTTVRHLNMHLRTVHFRKGKRIPCEECGKNNQVREFSSNFKLQAHIKLFHEGIVEVHEKKHVCTYCGKSFNRGTLLRLHENIHTKAVLFKCKQCPFAATSRSGLSRHLRIHTGEKPFKCDECDASFNQSNGLHSHKFAKHSDERPFSCEICGAHKRFKTKYSLQHHMKTHEKSGTETITTGPRIKTLGAEITVYDPELKCSFCPAVYRKEMFLCRHIVEKHPSEMVPMIPCDVCNETNKNVFFLTQDEKNRHADYHDRIKAQPEKERVCSECGQVFQTNTSYQQHRQTHIRIECKECGKSFSTSRTLRLHLLTVHLKSRPYKCDKCDSSFGQLSTLNTHMKVHQK